jgi:SAM-dependent methyltransferase
MYAINNYDIIARRYDFLSRLVFRQAQVRAQVQLLAYLDDGERILIVGGGTGWILEALTAARPSGLKITYVEISANMLALAARRNYGRNEVIFVHAPVEEFVTGEPAAAKLAPDGLAASGELPAGKLATGGLAAGRSYDSILTGFLFDNFSPEHASEAFQALDGLLKKGGAWLFTDFIYQKGLGGIWQRLLLQTMYLFFRLVCRVEAKQLTDMAPFFARADYREIRAAYHYGGLIKAVAYRKTR